MQSPRLSAYRQRMIAVSSRGILSTHRSSSLSPLVYFVTKPHRRFQSSLSSFNDPRPSLFHPDRLKQLSNESSRVKDEFNKQLRADVRTMGSILGKTIKHYAGEDMFNKIESLRSSAKVRSAFL